MRPPTYRERLRVEGSVLAGSGALGCALMLAFVDDASERPSSTISQLAFVTLLVAVLGPLLVRRSITGARPVASTGEELTGQPTPLWKPPLVTIVLTALFVVPGVLGLGAVGWDAGVRICGGCLLIGLAQALLVERLIAADERRSGRTFIRIPGTSAFGGTKLGFFARKEV
jgi:hypothetical protein